MQISLTFGLQLDNAALPYSAQVHTGQYYQGPKGLVLLLETYLGLSGHPSDLEFLRIEHFRQAIVQYLEQHPDAFFVRSFEADQFATAQDLLARRDELLMNGWDFSTDASTPTRIQTISGIEAFFSNTYPGYADRFVAVLDKLQSRKHPIKEIRLSEPLALLPYPFRRLFDALGNSGCHIIPFAEKADQNHGAKVGTDLHAFQQVLFGAPENTTLKGDGSLILIRAKSATELAAYTAQLYSANSAFRPMCLIPEKNRNLDNAFVQEGLPAMGLQSASLARPVLQILKLAPAFFWEPMDPYKMLEFVNLAIKPLDDDLANVIAGQLAATPGQDSENWKRSIARAFDQLASRYPDDPKRIAKARSQYQFWFRRKKYPIEGTVPKKEVIECFGFIQDWAYQLYDPEKGQNKSLLVLSEQAKRIREILEALPEQKLSNLEVERIVRTIYEPAPIVFQEEQKDRLNHIYHPGAVITPCGEFLWWNFIQSDPVHFFSKWYQSERKYLESIGIFTESPETENQRRLWLRKRPIRFCQERLMLLVPETIAGEATIAHPFMGELEASFDNLEIIEWDTTKAFPFEATKWNIPAYLDQEIQSLKEPDSFVQISRKDWMNKSHRESFTSLEALFYYPYKWVFKYQLKLRKSSILSVVPEETLMGNLAHRMFEMLFEEKKPDWTKAQLEKWIESKFMDLLAREGVVLLLYGREPQRIGFLNKLKFAAWSLVSSIQNNDWKITASEMELTGPFGAGKEFCFDMRGVADLVLERKEESAIIDLKWGGLSRRSNMIRNEEDLQLILYSLLHTGSPSKAHTAYFIIRDGRLVARDQAAFREVQAIQPDGDRQEINQGILDRMEYTYQWRFDQMKQGKMEVRCAATYEELEDAYADEGLEWNKLLEMRNEDSYYDDYRTLIGLF